MSNEIKDLIEKLTGKENLTKGELEAEVLTALKRLYSIQLSQEALAKQKGL